jgi:Leucine-rich repeat (LRR) protein
VACRFLDASFNRLSGVPDTIGKLALLSALNLGHNPLGAFPAPLGGLSALQELNLDATGACGWPSNIK